ncbi:MAG: type II toxin-antitoxin system VapC family toxin [Planctomycetes bacterium]|nr:type II toxin-antitoxin system VapC family toxin [Planctomycetota bacterium]
MPLERVFLDTSFALALFNQTDRRHSKARELWPEVRTAREVWLMEAILTEIGNSLSRHQRGVAAQFMRQCYSTSAFKVAAVSPETFQHALSLYQSHADKAWGMTDCISFVVMKRQHVSAALTADVHFVQAGFRALMRE